MAVLAGFHCDVVGCQLARRRVRRGQRQQQSRARVHEGRCDVGWARQLEAGGAAVAESVIHQCSRPRGCVCVCVCVCACVCVCQQFCYSSHANYSIFD